MTKNAADGPLDYPGMMKSVKKERGDRGFSPGGAGPSGGGSGGILGAELQFPPPTTDGAIVTTANGDKAIHSGHFMVSYIHNSNASVTPEDSNESSRAQTPNQMSTLSQGTFNEPSQREEKAPSSPGFDFGAAAKEVMASYQFGFRSSKQLSIDASLTKLFECMTLAYNGKLVSPKWKTFKGLKLLWKDKIRLNNAIWRAWHIQYINKKSPLVCQFVANPLADDAHSLPQAVVLEGKYWKRRMETVVKEYMKWRVYYKKKTAFFQRMNCPTDEDLLKLDALDMPLNMPPSHYMGWTLDDFYYLRERQEPCPWWDATGAGRDDYTILRERQERQKSPQKKETPLPSPFVPTFSEEDAWMMDFTDTLFSSLAQPFAFPNPKEIAHLGNADMIQPGLIQLQPNLEDFMDTFEPLQDTELEENECGCGLCEKEINQDIVRNAGLEFGGSSHMNLGSGLEMGQRSSQQGQQQGQQPNISIQLDVGSPHAMHASDKVFLPTLINKGNFQAMGFGPPHVVPPEERPSASATVSSPPFQNQMSADTMQYQGRSQAGMSYQESSPIQMDTNQTSLEDAISVLAQNTRPTQPPHIHSSQPASMSTSTQQVSQVIAAPTPITPSSTAHQQPPTMLPMYQAQPNIPVMPSTQTAFQTPTSSPQPNVAPFGFPQQQQQKTQTIQPMPALQQQQQQQIVSQGNYAGFTTVSTLPASTFMETDDQQQQQHQQQQQQQQPAPTRSRTTPKQYPLAPKPAPSATIQQGALGFTTQNAMQVAFTQNSLQQGVNSNTVQFIKPKGLSPIAPKPSTTASQTATILTASVGSPQGVGGSGDKTHTVSVQNTFLAQLLTGGSGAFTTQGIQPCTSAGTSTMSNQVYLTSSAIKPDTSLLNTVVTPSTTQGFVLAANPSQLAQVAGVTDFQSSVLVAAAAQAGKVGLPGLATATKVERKSPPVACSTPIKPASTPNSPSAASPITTEDSPGHNSETLACAPPWIIVKKLEEYKPTNTLNFSDERYTTRGVLIDGMDWSPAHSPGKTPSKLRSSQEKYKGGSDQRRAIHISAEQKRRFNIKVGFDTLHTLIPTLSSQGNVKISKAAMLQKTVDYTKKLQAERQQMLEEARVLKQEIEELNSAISNCQAQLPATGAPVTRQRSDHMKEMFDEYVRTRTSQNWKFWIFSLIIRPLFETYNSAVSTGSMEDFCRTVLSWLDEHCSLPALRPTVLNSLRQLSMTTSILSDPSLLSEQALQAVSSKRKSSESH
ncbi:PREDICTED: MLX-interacting protein-like isoform X3 [Branchiostoma belcheri]|uniref:MLX-interacting protein-like isoform X3 n=1 Tax=Branchiostoma belcheri TaxID=7741 RepID=A0A6P4YMY6_BRABE|nr:PREDICTED: MLX-interacting protein-like isoform X3 [Branchiostoma belcheri]